MGFEPCTSQAAVQDVDAETHSWVRPSPRLVCSDRPEGRVLSCLDPTVTQPFLRFAFEGRAYQYKVLPFGLSLSPCVFTKVLEAALVPLREQGVRILNYLDDWLILAQSRRQLSSAQGRSGPYGQHCDRCVYQLASRFTLPLHVATRPPPPPLESEASDVPSCHPHPRSVQSGSRRAVSSSTDTVQDQGGRGAGLVSGSILAQQDLVPRTHAPRDSPSLANSSEEGSAFSETGHPMAPASGPVETPRMVSDSTYLPQEVALTIASARAPSTRRAYTLKWNLFVEWCSSHQEDPRRCLIRAVLSFLQQGLERRLSPSTLKVYVADISTHHDPVEGKSVGQHNLVVRFLRGARMFEPS